MQTTTQSVIIKPRGAGASSLILEAKELWAYRHLLSSLVKREMRIRYRGSAIGILWSLIAPLVQIVAMTFAISIIAPGQKNPGINIMCAYLAWNFFQVAIMDATVSIHVYYPVLKKVYFPREIPVITSVCSNFIHLLISTGVFIFFRWGILAVAHGWPGWPPIEVLWLPVLLALTFILTLGVALFVTASNYFYEDIRFMTQMALNFALYLLPILYSAEYIYYSTKLGAPKIAHLLYHLYLANPLAWIVTGFKQIFFGPQLVTGVGAHAIYTAPFDCRYLLLTTISSLAILVAGYHYFNQLKWKFTERP